MRHLKFSSVAAKNFKLIQICVQYQKTKFAKFNPQKLYNDSESWFEQFFEKWDQIRYMKRIYRLLYLRYIRPCSVNQSYVSECFIEEEVIYDLHIKLLYKLPIFNFHQFGVSSLSVKYINRRNCLCTNPWTKYAV